jgi:hypothetical protein
VSSSAPSRQPGKQSEIDLAVSSYDRAAGWTIALNILVGSGVLLGFLIWLSSVLEFKPDQAMLTLVENVAGRGDHAAGFARDVEAPGIEELEEETEPKVEQLLEAVTDVVTNQAAALDAMNTNMFSSNVGSGLGDSRPPGPLGEGEDIIPRAERWEIRYNSNSLDAYAQQLDHFQIELGAVGGKKTVDYAANLGSPSPARREGPGGDAEKRLYMTWTTGALKRFDRQLLQKASISTQGRIIAQFYPANVENTLANLEDAYMRQNGKTHIRQVKRTVFGVKRTGRGFEYYVISQVYRAVPA